MILIGSSAIKHWFSDFKRIPKDIDWISEKNDSKIIDGKRNEYLVNDIFKDYSHPILLPNDLYTLKMSHLFWDINWEKHLFDVQFLKSKGCILDKELFYKLYNYWNTIHPKNKRSVLNMSAKDFFDNALKSEISHDFIHTLLKDVPTYTKILKDGAEVEVDENKFNLLSFEDKCSLVEEEVMVMAYERYKVDYRHAYSKMLKKFIISHAPLWEAIFIIENYVELHKAKYNYIKKIEEGLLKVKQLNN